MPASAGVRPPFFLLQFTQQVTMFSQSLRPPCATGTTWSKVNSAVGNASSQVLAHVLVACVDIRAGKRNVVEPALDFDESEEADDGGQLEADGHRPYLAVVDRDHLDLPLAPERNRLLPVNDLQRLVRRVQKERLLHDWIMMPSPVWAVKAMTP